VSTFGSAPWLLSLLAQAGEAAGKTAAAVGETEAAAGP